MPSVFSKELSIKSSALEKGVAYSAVALEFLALIMALTNYGLSHNGRLLVPSTIGSMIRTDTILAGSAVLTFSVGVSFSKLAVPIGLAVLYIVIVAGVQAVAVAFNLDQFYANGGCAQLNPRTYLGNQEGLSGYVESGRHACKIWQAFMAFLFAGLVIWLMGMSSWIIRNVVAWRAQRLPSQADRSREGIELQSPVGGTQ